MVGNFKRGGFRGGNGGDFKKGYTKKRSPEDDDDVLQASKKSKSGDEDQDDAAPMVPKLQTDEDNNPFIAINPSGKRRVTVSDFKGTTLISIREYWTNDGGELKPGKKGISLSVGQYNALLAAAPLLETVLSKKDVQVARPDYGTDVNAADPAEEGQQSTTNVANNDDED